ncbi:amidohydrolase family protein [Algibacter aquimarinus]
MIKYILFTASLLFVIQFTEAQIAVKGETVYTVTGETIKNGIVLIRDGKITKVGSASKVKIPNGFKIYEGKVVTPGLVDAHATVGFSGIYNQKSDQMQLDKSSPIQPELRAIDAYNPQESLVAFLNSNGITTVHTGHGPGAPISGQTFVAKTVGKTIEDVKLDDATMLAMTMGGSVHSNFKTPGTVAKEMAMLRSELIKAQEYQKKSSNSDASKRPARNLKMETLVMLLEGKLKALITANSSNSIMTAIRLAKEFNLKLVLDGASESYLLIDEIKAANAEVVLHPTKARGYGDMKNMSWETAGILANVGVPVAIQSGYEPYVPKTRVILFEAAIAVANGLSFNDGLKSITINAAKIIGQDNRIGSLEKGKDGDVVIFDGDPFEYLTTVTTVITNGELSYEVKK